ncbi:hypothetical protein GDR29_15770 [Xanthomonas oryzae pv. oryzae]|nr:hypothetical protein GDR29_15770 [Xanthomonas oryzae pv. oryzae]
MQTGGVNGQRHHLDPLGGHMAQFGGHFLIDHLLACAEVQGCGDCELRHQEILVFFDIVDRHAFF